MGLERGGEPDVRMKKSNFSLKEGFTKKTSEKVRGNVWWGLQSCTGGAKENGVRGVCRVGEKLTEE